MTTNVGCWILRKTTSQAEKYIEDLTNGNHLNENNLDETLSSSLQSVLKDVKTL